MISPEDSSIVAINSLPLVHTPPGMVLSKVVVPSEHKAVVPLKVPAFGSALTVTVLVAIASQPSKSVMV